MIELLHYRATQRFNFTGFVCRNSHRLYRRDVGAEVLLAIFNIVDLGALLTFNQHLDRAIWQLEQLQNGGNAAHIKHVFNYRFIFGGSFLRDQHDATLGFHGRLKRLDTLGAPHKQGYHHVREHHHIAQRQKGQVYWSGRQGCGG